MMTLDNKRLILAEQLQEEIEIIKYINANVFYWLKENRPVNWKTEGLYVAQLVENAFTHEQKVRYWNVLGDVIYKTGKMKHLVIDLTFATFEQRMEAIIRTLGLWEEN